MDDGTLHAQIGRADGAGAAAFAKPLREALDAEMARFGVFMNASSTRWSLG